MQHNFSFPEDRFLLVGTVTKPQGLRGEVCVHSLSGQPENFHAYGSLYLVDQQGEISPELQVTSCRLHKQKVILSFDRVKDRNHAELLVGMGVLVDIGLLPDLPDDQFYWHELFGDEVVTLDGDVVGTLESVFSNGAQDVMVVIADDREILIPLSPGTFAGKKEGRLVIDPVPGLLEINLGQDEEETD